MLYLLVHESRSLLKLSLGRHILKEIANNLSEALPL